jgi:hypothetical protein
MGSFFFTGLLFFMGLFFRPLDDATQYALRSTPDGCQGRDMGLPASAAQLTARSNGSGGGGLRHRLPGKTPSRSTSHALRLAWGALPPSLCGFPPSFGNRFGRVASVL